MKLVDTEFGKPPLDRKGNNIFIKPLSIPPSERVMAIEYGVPFLTTNPTYVLAASTTLPAENYDQEEALMDTAADIVESYARIGFYGGFVLSQVRTHETIFTIWVTDFKG